jgi:hypothetical protein
MMLIRQKSGQDKNPRLKGIHQAGRQKMTRSKTDASALKQEVIKCYGKALPPAPPGALVLRDVFFIGNIVTYFLGEKDRQTIKSSV